MEKFRKVIVALVAAMCVAMSAFVFVGCGDDPAEGDGSENAVKWTGVAGTVPTAVENVIEIENGEQLAALALAVRGANSFKGITVKLTADINLDNKAWTPIGDLSAYAATTFMGVFDGDGHTIYNLNVSDTTSGTAAAGLFGTAAGTIKNLTLKNVKVTSAHYAGAIVGYAHWDGSATTIENCKVIGGTITASPELIGNEYDNGDKAGGIIGYANVTTVKNCSVKNVTVNGYRDLGGVVGYANSNATVINNTIENVKIRVNKEHNYKNYADLSAHDANSIIGETASGAVVSGNAGSADIAFAG